MRKKFDFEWEKLDASTKRAKVISGWIVLHETQIISTKGLIAATESMVFILDRDHEWMIPAIPLKEKVMLQENVVSFSD